VNVPPEIRELRFRADAGFASSTCRSIAHVSSSIWVDIHVRVFAQLPRTKLAQVFFARNAALVELGEEFHVFVDKSRKGAFSPYTG
jgi:hypothetical protein